METTTILMQAVVCVSLHPALLHTYDVQYIFNASVCMCFGGGGPVDRADVAAVSLVWGGFSSRTSAKKSNRSNAVGFQRYYIIFTSRIRRSMIFCIQHGWTTRETLHIIPPEMTRLASTTPPPPYRLTPEAQTRQRLSKCPLRLKACMLVLLGRVGLSLGVCSTSTSTSANTSANTIDTSTQQAQET